MKKYITTDKHPLIKEGIEFDEDQIYSSVDEYVEVTYYKDGSFGVEYSDEVFNEHLSQGYIKELQEPKWTDQNMIDFVRWWNVKGGGNHTFEEDFKQWEKQRS